MKQGFMRRTFGKMGGFYTIAVPVYILILVMSFNRGGVKLPSEGDRGDSPAPQKTASVEVAEADFDYYNIQDADGVESIYQPSERIIKSMDSLADNLMSGGGYYFDDVSCVSLTRYAQNRANILCETMNLGGDFGVAAFGAVKDSGKWEYFFVPADGSGEYLVFFKLPDQVSDRKGFVDEGAQIDIYTDPSCNDSTTTLVVGVRKENGDRMVISYYPDTNKNGEMEFVEAGTVKIKDTQNAYLYSYNELHLVTNGLLGQKVKIHTFSGSSITEEDGEA